MINLSRLLLFSLITLASTSNSISLSIVQIVLLLAIIVYIPMIVEKFYHFKTYGVEIISGLTITYGFNLIQGPIAAMLVVPWIITTTAITFRLFLKLDMVSLRSKELNDYLLLSSISFLPLASSALFISRLGLQPVDFSHTIIQLTAVHFHYTGVTIPLFVYFMVTSLQDIGIKPIVPTILIIIGTPLVAIGITLGQFFNLPGFIAVLIFTGALCFLACLTIINHIYFNRLIVIANAIIIPSMILAIYYAAGVAFEINTISISEMVITHGIINAGIYLPLNILGWEQRIETN